MKKSNIVIFSGGSSLSLCSSDQSENNFRCFRFFIGACATYEALHLRSASDAESELTKYLFQNSRIPGPANDRCPGASHGPCLLACSTSLPAPFRAVSTWYSHKRDQPNNACCCRSDYVLQIRTQPKIMNHNALFSQQQQTAGYYHTRVPDP